MDLFFGKFTEQLLTSVDNIIKMGGCMNLPIMDNIAINKDIEKAEVVDNNTTGDTVSVA